LIEDTSGSTQANDDDDDDDKALSTRFSLNTIFPLSRIPNLRNFTLDGNFLSHLDNRDVDEITRWWPNLDSLDLGCLYNDEDVELSKWRPRTTLACLISVAAHCREMQRLVLPVDIDGDLLPEQVPPLSHHRLRKLVILPSGQTVTESTINYVYKLFPALEELDVCVP